MSEKNLWSGDIEIPHEHYTEDKMRELLEAMGIYMADDWEPQPPVPGSGQFAFSPEADLLDPYADYYDEAAVSATLLELHATGVLRAVFVDGDYAVTEFEVTGDHVRKWFSPDDAMMTQELPGHIRLNYVLYRLERVEEQSP